MLTSLRRCSVPVGQKAAQAKNSDEAKCKKLRFHFLPTIPSNRRCRWRANDTLQQAVQMAGNAE